MGVLSPSATETLIAAIRFESQQKSPPLLRGVFPATRGGAFSISTTRTHICLPKRRPLFFRVESVESSSTVEELQDIRVVPSTVLTAEKKEAKAVLKKFLKKEIGLSNAAAAATIRKSVHFIDHLVARLHSYHKTRYPVGRELSALEIRDVLIPYLDYLCDEHEDNLVDFMENFPNPLEEEREQHLSEASPAKLPLDSKKLKAMARMTEIGTDGQLPPNTLYLVDIGLDINQIKGMACKYPPITYPGWGKNMRPLVEFLLDLGVPPSDIPSILYNSPNLCDFSLSENIIPSMAYLETLGLDKSKWAKVIKRFPSLLRYSKQKVNVAVDYLYELGLSRDKIGKVLTRFPGIIGFSVDDNLRPKVEYFRSMGVSHTSLLSRYPEVFGLSIECKLKPVTEFFLDKGFSIDEIGNMASSFGSIYSMSLTKNLIPKWDFFLTMGYPREVLVKYPNYFGYSLEGRIKPRFSQVREWGVNVSLGYLLGQSDSEFEKLLNRSMKIGLVAQHDSIHVTSDYDRK